MNKKSVVMRALYALVGVGASLQAQSILTVCSSGCSYNAVQSAIDSAPEGGIIELKAGEIFTENVVVLGKRNLVIRSSRWRELPQTGYRIDPVAHASLLATIRTANVDPALTLGPYENVAVPNGVNPADDTITFGYTHLASRFSEGKAITCLAASSNNGLLPAPLAPGRKYWIREWNAAMQRGKISETLNGPPVDLVSAGSASSPNYYARPRCVLWEYPRQIAFEGIRFDNTFAAQTYSLVMVGHNREVDRQNMGPAEVRFQHTVMSGIQDDASGPKFCLSLSGYKLVVRDSWIGHCKVSNDESKAIGVRNVTGAEIVNNYISGASINLLTAGEDSAALDVNRDLVITGNSFEKPGYMMYKEGTGSPSGECYYGGGSGSFYRRTDVSPNTCSNGACYSCGTDNQWRLDRTAYYRNTNYLTKNLLELKDCENCRIEGNYLGGSFAGPDTGQGWCFGISVIVSGPGISGGGSGYHRAHNVAFRNNWADACYSGVHITNSQYDATFNQVPIKNVVVENNALTNFGWASAMSQFTDPGLVNRFALKQGTGINGFRFANNTILARQHPRFGLAFYQTGYEPHEILETRYENNLISAGDYPVFLDSSDGDCTASGLFKWFRNDGSKQFQNNVFLGGAANWFLGNSNCISTAAANNIFGITDATLGFASLADARLRSTSPFNSANIGADIDVIEQYAIPARKGEPSVAEQLGLTVTVGSRLALLQFTRPENTACEVTLYNGPRIPSFEWSDTNTAVKKQADRVSSVINGRSVTFLAGAYTALTPDTHYKYRVVCGAQSALGTFKSLKGGASLPDQQPLSVDTTTLNFIYIHGSGNLPAARNFTVRSAGLTSFVLQPTASGWLSVPLAFGTTPGTVNVQVNPSGLLPGAYFGSIVVEAPGRSPATVTVSLSVLDGNAGIVGSGSHFVAIPPCRLADTRSGSGVFGGGPIAAGMRRDFPISQSACNIPANASAYWLNATVIPSNSLSYLTLWPTGTAQPQVSTLNAFDGSITSNAAIVQAGANGAISAYSTDRTDLILDISGYFISAPSPQALAMYPITPCRIADTRQPSGVFGGPRIIGGTSRDFPILSGACGLPSNAMAYSLTITVVPSGRLAYLTTYPTGMARPAVSTLNSDGRIKANAAVVPAGVNGGISVFVTDTTDVIVDVNAYFAPPGNAGGLQFYPVTPFRAIDTRLLPANPLLGVLNIPIGAAPSNAVAISANVTAIPTASLGYLTMWPSGTPQPAVSTLNASHGKIVANAAVTALGTGRSVNVLVTDPANYILDVNGYFAP